MESGGHLVGLGIAQVCCSRAQRLTGGILIAGADAGVAQQECRQIIR